MALAPITGQWWAEPGWCNARMREFSHRGVSKQQSEGQGKKRENPITERRQASRQTRPKGSMTRLLFSPHAEPYLHDPQHKVGRAQCIRLTKPPSPPTSLHEQPLAAQSRGFSSKQPATMQTALSMNMVPVVAPRATRATLQRPAARSATFQARTVSNGATVKAMQVRTILFCLFCPALTQSVGVSLRGPASSLWLPALAHSATVCLFVPDLWRSHAAPHGSAAAIALCGV